MQRLCYLSSRSKIDKQAECENIVESENDVKISADPRDRSSWVDSSLRSADSQKGRKRVKRKTLPRECEGIEDRIERLYTGGKQRNGIGNGERGEILLP